MQTDINGAIISVKIVAAVSTFPTVSAGGGALIVDLGRVQDVLASSALAAAQVTQWWLATSRRCARPGWPPTCRRAPPSSARRGWRPAC